MGGSCESQTRGWFQTLVGFSSETSPDTHKEHHKSRENTSPLSWWWREMKPPPTHLRLFSRNRAFVCREKSHETVGWGHWWKSHWWWRLLAEGTGGNPTDDGGRRGKQNSIAGDGRSTWKTHHEPWLSRETQMAWRENFHPNQLSTVHRPPSF